MGEIINKFGEEKRKEKTYKILQSLIILEFPIFTRDGAKIISEVKSPSQSSTITNNV